jgi:hypothetical protein
MATLKIYKYEYTHPTLGKPVLANRMGTREYIEKIGGWVVVGSGIEVDASKVDAGGKTEIGFDG